MQPPGGLQAHHTPLPTPETWEQPREAAQLGCPGRLETQQGFFEKGPEMGQTGKAGPWRLSPPSHLLLIVGTDCLASVLKFPQGNR